MTTLADRYELIEKIGEGGMGVVWRAHDTKLERTVAIKLLRSFVAAEPDQRRRFAREARTLAGLSNDHVVRVYDYVEDGDDAFLVMELVEGRNLADATFARLPVAWSEAASYAAPVCEALAYAHAKGVIHRDLTPANILIERDTGRVVTTDFGLARVVRSADSLTSIGVLAGTPEYWSPEQALGRDTDSPADMYALGCIVYLLLSGRLPFEGEDRLAIGLRRAHEDPPSLHDHLRQAPDAAVALVASLLSRDPSLRPDARSAAIAFAGAGSAPEPRAGDSAVPARGPDAPTPLLPVHEPTEVTAGAASAPTVRIAASPPASRRRRRWVATVLGVAVAAVVGVTVAESLREPVVRAPSVVHLREATARARILRTLPTATVSVVRVYSTRIAADRVIHQHPAARTKLERAAEVTLTVSRGSPFAEVPAIAAGSPAGAAKVSLARRGFAGRYRFTPSWSVRKGTVIELRPGPGTRVRRPATVKIVVASGYPREAVPDVQNVDLGSAQRQLEAKHLGYTIVHRLAPTSSPGRVVTQLPRPGAIVYRGTRVRLVVTRALRWERVFADSGSDAYVSSPFTVPRRWRIRYRLGGGDGYSGVSTAFAWARAGDFFGDGNFVAETTGALQVYDVPDGAGTYQLSVSPYSPATTWYVEVDALE